MNVLCEFVTFSTQSAFAYWLALDYAVDGQCLGGFSLTDM